MNSSGLDPLPPSPSDEPRSRIRPKANWGAVVGAAGIVGALFLPLPEIEGVEPVLVKAGLIAGFFALAVISLWRTARNDREE